MTIFVCPEAVARSRFTFGFAWKSHLQRSPNRSRRIFCVHVNNFLLLLLLLLLCLLILLYRIGAWAKIGECLTGFIVRVDNISMCLPFLIFFSFRKRSAQNHVDGITVKWVKILYMYACLYANWDHYFLFTRSTEWTRPEFLHSCTCICAAKLRVHWGDTLGNCAHLCIRIYAMYAFVCMDVVAYHPTHILLLLLLLVCSCSQVPLQPISYVYCCFVALDRLPCFIYNTSIAAICDM